LGVFGRVKEKHGLGILFEVISVRNKRTTLPWERFTAQKAVQKMVTLEIIGKN